MEFIFKRVTVFSALRPFGVADEKGGEIDTSRNRGTERCGIQNGCVCEVQTAEPPKCFEDTSVVRLFSCQSRRLWCDHWNMLSIFIQDCGCRTPCWCSSHASSLVTVGRNPVVYTLSLQVPGEGALHFGIQGG